MSPRFVLDPPRMDGITDAALARVLQWVVDKLQHIDECLDDVKDTVAQNQSRDSDMQARLDEHQRFHDLMEATTQGRQAEHKRYFGWVPELVKEIPKLAVGAALLAGGGIGALITQLF